MSKKHRNASQRQRKNITEKNTYLAEYSNLREFVPIVRLKLNRFIIRVQKSKQKVSFEGQNLSATRAVPPFQF